VNLLDLLILVIAALAGVGGWRLGFVARAASWIGMAVGIVAVARLLPFVLDLLGGSEPSARLMVATGTLLAGALAGQAVGLVIGARVHFALPDGAPRALDRGGGGVAGVLGIFALVWLLLPAMADVPGTPARLARHSAIGRAIHEVAPRPPDTLQALRRLVGDNAFPQVFNDLAAAPRAGPPPEASGLPPEVLEAATRASVRVEGAACRRIQEGSGVALAPGLVVTNAHVVAGETRTEVERGDGERAPAEVVLFDPDRDLAVLRVPDGFVSPLALVEGGVGQTGGVFGHPGGGDLRVAPFQITEQVRAVGRDLYDSRDIERDVYVLASALEPGDSGGPLVVPGGEVVGVAFAVAPDRRGVSYALTAAEVRAVLAAVTGTTVDTGECLST
jgi:S1-C subfamily serine protease